ncbi:putative anti-sigma regulatory factor, serine/threonine protein kinase [Paenibacillus curdlanolyticus YK9]|uniref:Putative anti-sigma regulatory factor, serine/threonine protein kinase n=1 Tax=Paenibacillus curdlanolyticus YK9 TaxID=717606 RepID=E0I6J5_9BACL|nr:hypothetical protein [Paenibacillus curdlanolyticus]EFM11661.1 putative anti-sigma regulatory factor, serine/threonine protein kinase [Paenibacillus curdlanolyticus YK9]
MDMFLIKTPSDAISVRQRGRDIARKVGFGAVDQTRIAFTISEMALQLADSPAQGHMVIKAITRNKQELGIEVRLFDHATDANRWNPEWMNKWVDDLEVKHDDTRGTVITFRRWLPPSYGYERQAGPSVLAAGEE